jgi:hypothetical protein
MALILAERRRNALPNESTLDPDRALLKKRFPFGLSRCDPVCGAPL